MNIGIFSGSFNPIHIGHLILANYITEFTSIDEVWFLVTPHNPLKDKSILIEEDIRLRMVGLGLKDFPKLKMSDIEFGLPKPSYTINTLQALEETYPEHNFSLIIGADNWELFDQWKDYKVILDHYKIYVYPRYGYSITVPHLLKNKVQVLDSPIVEVSSTFIRDGVSKSKNMRALLPCEVYDYINENHLYR